MNPLIKNYEQEEAIALYKIVTAGTADDQVKHADDSAEVIIGVANDYTLSQAVNSAIGKRVDITRLGLAEVKLGGAVSRGDLLTTNASGLAVKVTDNMVNAATIFYLGFAEADGVENDIIEALVIPGKLSKLDGVTASANELNILDGVTATAAELNMSDLSEQTETKTEAGAVSVVKKVTKITETVGGYAVTLAAPNAAMLGQVKIIEMTARNAGAVTMALTNVVGGSQAASASFDAAGEALILVAGTTKWIVVKEVGVTLS